MSNVFDAGKISKKVLIYAAILILASTMIVGLVMFFGSMAMTILLSGKRLLRISLSMK